jgi:hypothetical protein
VIYYGSFSPITRSWTGYLMSLPTSRWLGDFAFQVYLFRYPIFASLSWYEHDMLQFGNMYLSWMHPLVRNFLSLVCVRGYSLSKIFDPSGSSIATAIAIATPSEPTKRQIIFLQCTCVISRRRALVYYFKKMSHYLPKYIILYELISRCCVFRYCITVRADLKQ